MIHTLYEIQTFNPFNSQYAIDGDMEKGYITIDEKEGSIAWLVWLVVDEAIESNGVATVLLAAGMKWASKRNLKTVISDFQPQRNFEYVAGWYRKRGFKVGPGRNMRGDVNNIHSSCLQYMNLHDLDYRIIPISRSK
ncbi:MAG: GNAT family N-acetyltransferase [Microgenomates group bacterium]